MPPDAVSEQVAERREAVHALFDGMMGMAIQSGGLSVDDRISRRKNRIDPASSDISTLQTQVSILTERIGHLPTKVLGVKCAIGTVTVIAAIITYFDKSQGLVH